VVLHAVPVKHLDPPVVALERQGDRYRTLRLDHPVTVLLRDFEMIGQHLELPHCHAENGI
jgi:hypothetical protein